MENVIVNFKNIDIDIDIKNSNHSRKSVDISFSSGH
jgi:hypothetical protein